MKSAAAPANKKAARMSEKEANTNAGPRAVLGSQRPPTQNGAQIRSTLPMPTDALRAEDGSRSGACAAAPVGFGERGLVRALPILLAILASALLLLSLKLPLWQMRLEAPQYRDQEALRVAVHPNSFRGD